MISRIKYDFINKYCKNIIFKIISSNTLKIKQYALLLGYMIIVYILYSSEAMNNTNMLKISANQALWNYVAAFALIKIMFLASKWARTRPLPNLPHTKCAELILCSSILLYMLLIILFWRFYPFLIALLSIYIHKILILLPINTKGLIENAVYTFPITAFAVGISIWRLKGWRKYSLKLSGRDVLIVLLLIITSICLKLLRNKLFGIPYTNMLPPAIVGALSTVVAQFFINGLAEECFNRGYIFPQLLAFLKSPWICMWFMVVVFNASHVPSLIIGQYVHIHWWQWILYVIFPPSPTGWVFGFIYYRLRTFMPGALYHSSLSGMWIYPFFG